jgi:hypothetical protein
MHVYVVVLKIQWVSQFLMQYIHYDNFHYFHYIFLLNSISMINPYLLYRREVHPSEKKVRSYLCPYVYVYAHVYTSVSVLKVARMLLCVSALILMCEKSSYASRDSNACTRARVCVCVRCENVEMKCDHAR